MDCSTCAYLTLNEARREPPVGGTVVKFASQNEKQNEKHRGMEGWRGNELWPCDAV